MRERAREVGRTAQRQDDACKDAGGGACKIGKMGCPRHRGLSVITETIPFCRSKRAPGGNGIV